LISQIGVGGCGKPMARTVVFAAAEIGVVHVVK
jgi:hypothetical protein